MIGLSILLAVVIYVWLARFATKRIKNRAAKFATIALFILIPTWDIIPGKLYFNHLCKNEAGVKVYQTVVLPAEYWDEKGLLKKEEFRLGEKYPLSYISGVYFSVFYIESAGYRLTEKNTGKTMGEVVDFRYWGGWLVRNLGTHNTATSCDNQRGRFDELVGNIFKSVTSTR